MKRHAIEWAAAAVAILVGATALAQSEQATLWKPAEDEVFLQEINGKVPTGQPITSLGLSGDDLYAIVDGQLQTLAGEAFEAVAGAPQKPSRLWTLDGALWLSAADGSFRFDGRDWAKLSNEPFVDMCMHLGAVHGATVEDIFKFDGNVFVNIKPEHGYLTTNTSFIMEDGTQILPDPIRIGPINAIASYSGTIYLVRGGRLALLDGDALNMNPIDFGEMISNTLRDLTSFGSRLFIATDRGLGVLRGMAYTTLTGEDRLPYEDTTCVARGFDRDVWIGTTTGAIRKTEDDYHYFGPDHWLPGNNVHDIAVGDRVVYVATDAGLGIIRYEPYTLRKKAAYFERAMDEWGLKRLGFIHKLFWMGDDQGWQREVSDNDGGHSSQYLAAMSYKYAATGDADARREAIDTFEAMVWLETITPKEGFVARAIWSPDHDTGIRSSRGSGGLPAEWYETEDGLWQWKGDTSSDEISAHVYSVSVFHDLVAQGKYKARAAEHIRRIANHIIDNGWVLSDMDDKPTRWGRWDPEYLLRPYGYYARGLNGMEVQSYMWTAYALTGEEKFMDGLHQLVDWGYPTYTVREKLTFPPEDVVPWDDLLAFRAFYPILHYADNPKLRSIYLRALERHYEVMRMQHVPLYNFMYGALTGNDCEIDEAVTHLREWSLDLRCHNYTNSHRDDLHPEPGYVPYGGGTIGLSPRETSPMWSSRPAIQYDGGHGGRDVTPPVGWLEDYWMGRYHGFIKAPKVRDRDLTTVDKRPNPQFGAKPFDGPPRPKIDY